MFVMPNTFVRSVVRAGALDRYGNTVNETIYSKFGAFFDKSSKLIVASNGETQTIDATMILDPRFELRVGDIVNLDTSRPEQYRVFDIQEHIDDLGVIEAYSYRLVKLLMTR